MKKVYFIISAYNEEDNIDILIDSLESELAKIRFEDYEFVFVNDGSKDNTLDVLLKRQKINEKIVIINQSTNFGHELAMTAGLNYTVSENKSKDFSVLFMDADMQHPPEIAVQIIKLWLGGEKLILTKRTDNEDAGLRYKIMGNLYYWILNFLSDVKIPRNMPDFRLLDKKYVLWMNGLNETDRMFRGMLSLIGLRNAHIIEFDAPKRNAGTSKYNFLKLYSLSLNHL